MAEWINLFDLGECVVRVRHIPAAGGDFTTLFDDVMTFGSTSTFPWPGRATSLTISIGSSSGVVSLSSDDENNPDGNERFSVDVRLSTPIESEGSRAVSVNLFGKTSPEVFDEANQAFGIVNDNDGSVPLTVVENPDVPELRFVDPDPAVLTDAPGSQDFIGITALKVLA